MKKIFLSVLITLGILNASSTNIYSGLVIVPQAKYKFDNDTLKTELLLGFNVGMMKQFENNTIIGGDIETVFGKMKDSNDKTGSIDIKLNGGYRFNTNYPTDVYAIIGYRHSEIGDTGANGFGYGAGIAINISLFRPTIEYTHFSMKANGDNFDDDRISFQLNFNRF